jgi:hypothetical protein
LALYVTALAATALTAWPSTADRYVDDEVDVGSGKLAT